MRVFVIAIMLIMSAAADDCSYYMKLGYSQEHKAAQAYKAANIVEMQKRLRFALSNYMSAFKPCLNTDREKEMLDNTSRVNKILTDQNFRDAAYMQKFLRAK